MEIVVIQSNEPVLSVGQVAARLGVSRGLVYGLCAARKIRHERHGRAIRISEAALADYRRGRTIDVEAGAASVPPP
jgi:excisionase family DNA binding protein